MKFKKIKKNSKNKKIFFLKNSYLKLLVLERSGLHHRVENIEKFLPYEFYLRDHKNQTHIQLPHKKIKTIISPG